MKKLRRRLGSALLIVAMLLSMFPSSAFAAFDQGAYGYYFYNTTDSSLGDNVEVYYSTDGQTLTKLKHGDTAFVSYNDVERETVTAIVFYVRFNDSATNAGVTFTTDNQQGILNTVSKMDGQAVIDGQGNTIGGTNFDEATNTAYDLGCTYAFFYSQFTWREHGGQNRFRGFQVWLELPTEQYSIAYHSNISSTGDTTQYQTLNTTAGDTKLWDAVYVRDGYVLTGWNTQADGNGQSFELGQSVNKGSFSSWSNTGGSTYTTDLYAIWEKELEAGSLNIQVYVDGQLKTFNSETDLQQYITSINATGQTDEGIELSYDGNTIHCIYDFTTYDAADLLLTVADGYVLQGIDGTFIFGQSGWNGITFNSGNGEYTIDNVDGQSTLKIYLNTRYTVEYSVPEGVDDVTDNNVYVVTKALNESTTFDPDFSGITVDSPQVDRTKGHTGGWTNKELESTVNLQGVPANCTGWYTTASGSDPHSKSYTGNGIKQAAESSGDNTPNVIECYARGAQYTITINYEDESGASLKEAYNDTQNAGYPYSFDVSENTTGNIPFIIEKDGKQYVFNRFTKGGDQLVGELSGNLDITAEYLIDENNNKVPDVYEATVTYQVVNGTWSDGTTTEKTEPFTLKTFDAETNTWIDASPAPTLGETIPTGMQPNDDYLADDAAWNAVISPDTLVTASITYIYSFTKAKAPALTVEKTVVSVGAENVTDQDSIPHAQVGDAIVYKIEVTNTGNVALTGINVTDTMKIPGDDGSLIDNGKKVTLYSDVDCEEEFSSTFDLEPDATQTLYAKYEVVQEDAGKQLTNSVIATSGGTSGTDDAPSVDVDALYQLTYDGNAQQGGKVEDIPASTSHHAGNVVTLSTDKPTHSDVNDTDVVFLGWSLEQTDKIYAAGENYKEKQFIEDNKVTFEEKNITVYAVWGYDTNGDGTADATQVMIQPAAMTIYTGGDGYLGTVNDASGTTVGAAQSGLPEPGFYFTLPYDMNQAIRDAAGTSGNAADLSNYLTIGAKADSETGTNEDRSWTIQLYDPNGTSDVNGKYVYSFDPSTGQKPVRMQFTNGEDIIISDEFNVNEALHQEYTMSLYTGSVLADTVQAVVKISGKNDLTATVGLWDSTLTIRGVTDEGTSTGIVDNVSDAVDTITASTEGGKVPTYYINGSQIQVTNQDDVKLLVDSIVDSELADGSKVHDTLLDMAKDELPSSYDGVEFKYLDLVDSSNGNVWVTMGDNDSLTVYWPYPAGTDKNDDFTIIHYKGLDREFDLKDLETQDYTLETYSTEDGTLECTDQGIKFTVSSFSPFALVYDKQTSGGGGGGTTPNPPDLNTEDHFSYVVGYEDGMVKPENAITRAEVASIFYRLLKDEVRDENTTDVSEFSDVSASDWYGTTVATLSSMDIVRGYEDGTFRPNAPITRAEFAAIATRFFEETGAEYEPGTFDDVTGDEWFANAIADAVELGLIGGYPDGTVRPNNNITRAEACAVVNRTLGRIPHVDHLLPADEMRTWPDNNLSDWFYADMQEATNGHEYEWTKEDGQKVEEWTEILDKDWEDR